MSEDYQTGLVQERRDRAVADQQAEDLCACGIDLDVDDYTPGCDECAVRKNAKRVKNNLAAALAVQVFVSEADLRYAGFTNIVCALHEWLDAEL